MYEEVVQTKFEIPPLRSPIVPRLKLKERLESCSNQKVVFISAPAGFGKTTLLNEWARGTKEPVGWFSIDQEDNDLKAFWTYFISAIQVVHADFGEAALKLLRSPQRMPIRTILTTVINEI